MSETSYDIFFAGPDGFGEHIQIKAESPLEAFETRSKILELLVANNAKPLERDMPRAKFGAPVSAQAAPRDPMQAAAAATGFISGAQVQSICPNDGSVMKNVPAGVSRKTGRPYPAFVACNDCGHKANAGGQ